MLSLFNPGKNISLTFDLSKSKSAVSIDLKTIFNNSDTVCPITKYNLTLSNASAKPLTSLYATNFKLDGTTLVVSPSATGYFELFAMASTDSGKFIYQPINVTVSQPQSAALQVAPIFDTPLPVQIPVTIEFDTDGKLVEPSEFSFTSPKALSPMGNKV